ncbi:MAG: hypothetical protein ACSLFC_12750, partial [Desulfuromonadales bacterium]
MELVIEERGKSFGKVHHARIAEIHRHLKSASSREDAESLLALADALLTYSHSHALLKLTSRELLGWLEAFLDFLRRRDEEVMISSFQPENSGSSFLLVNTPDVPYLVDSLKNILQQLPQRAMVISHPVLTVQRSNGRLESLGKKTDSGTRESFMLVQFEGVRDLDTAAIEADIRRVLLVAQTVGRQRKELEEKLGNLAQIAENQEQKDFVEWLLEGNFICFGYAAVEVSVTKNAVISSRLLEDPVGWLPESLVSRGKGPQKSLQLMAGAKEFFARKNPLVVDALDEQSPI